MVVFRRRHNYFHRRLHFADMSVAEFQFLLQRTQDNFIQTQINLHLRRQRRNFIAGQFAGEHLVKHRAQRRRIAACDLCPPRARPSNASWRRCRPAQSRMCWNAPKTINSVFHQVMTTSYQSAPPGSSSSNRTASVSSFAGDGNCAMLMIPRPTCFFIWTF